MPISSSSKETFDTARGGIELRPGRRNTVNLIPLQKSYALAIPAAVFAFDSAFPAPGVLKYFEQVHTALEPLLVVALDAVAVEDRLHVAGKVEHVGHVRDRLRPGGRFA